MVESTRRGHCSGWIGSVDVHITAHHHDQMFSVCLGEGALFSAMVGCNGGDRTRMVGNRVDDELETLDEPQARNR